MKRTLLGGLALFSLVSLIHAEGVTVTVTEVNDNRTTAKNFFQGMELVLKLQGRELSQAKGMKVTLLEAKDDAGTVLEKDQGMDFGGDNFKGMAKAFGFPDEKKADEFEYKLKLTNPARAAKTLKLSASLQLLLPAKDPASVLSVNPAKEAGKVLEVPALKASGVSLKFDAPKGSEITYSLSDPKGVVALIEFCAADGKPLETDGRSSSRMNNGPASISVSLKGKVGADTVAKIYLVTPGSVLTVPIKLDAVALP